MELFPPIPYHDWADTKDTLHRFAQIVGKIRLAASARRNHWWNVPFHLTGRGTTTRPMRLADGTVFCVDFDFVAHRLVATTLDGRQTSFPLAGRSVADFYTDVLAALSRLGVEVRVASPRPFDLPDSDRLFAEDTEHRSYDTTAATRYWRVLSQVNLLLEDFASDYSGKISPVHHFWHTFDIAVTRFGNRIVDQPGHVDPVTREAYSREVISAGFWFGDENFPEPAFYSYTAPEPDGLSDQPLAPGAARWLPQRQSHLAVLRYDDARAAADPWTTVLEFYRSAYRAGASLAGWDTDRMACPGGVTDPAARSTAATRSAAGSED